MDANLQVLELLTSGSVGALAAVVLGKTRLVSFTEKVDEEGEGRGLERV